MEYARLGRTGLKVSRLCLGTMNFGPETTEPDSFRILDKALDAGINFVDTANVYGRSAGRGATEKILGNWFAQGGARRDKVVLATKVYGRMDEGPNDARLSARHIRQACEASLTRLRTDHIDLYQMHHVDRDTPWDEIWQAMEQLVREGKILYVGSSNFAAWHIVQANERARERHLLGLVSEQSLYHLNARQIELEVIPACQAYGVAILPWSPLGAGLLAGALDKAKEGRRSSEFVRERVERNRDKLVAYEALCRELGTPPAEVGLAWVLAQPGVTAPIVGPRTEEQLDSALRAAAFKLADNADAMGKLDAIFPGPGQAPESYAW
jgi:aryl-alcohol dehydrogenase-like predicted oxidoreductase